MESTAPHSGVINGIHMEWADTATTAEERAAGRPAVLFLHGWPESWYSWRFQLAAVKAAGYRGIAPSMRGYGGTEAPDEYASYNVYTLAADALGLLQRLGIERVALVGHDHGANLGWKLCLLHPRVFTAYVAMSVPYGGRPKAAPLSGLRAKFGHEADSGAAFNYQLHHCLPCAASQYDAAPRAALLALYSDPSTQAGGGFAAPPVQSSP